MKTKVKEIECFLSKIFNFLTYLIRTASKLNFFKNICFQNFSGQWSGVSMKRVCCQRSYAIQFFVCYSFIVLCLRGYSLIMSCKHGGVWTRQSPFVTKITVCLTPLSPYHGKSLFAGPPLQECLCRSIVYNQMLIKYLIS